MRKESDELVTAKMTLIITGLKMLSSTDGKKKTIQNEEVLVCTEVLGVSHTYTARFIL